MLLPGRSDTTAFPTPRHENNIRNQTAFKNFVPSDGSFSFVTQESLHPFDEEGLQLILVFQLLPFHDGLCLGTLLPAIFCYLVASDVDIRAREEHREYGMTPKVHGVAKELLYFEGKYESKGKYFAYDHPGYSYKDMDIDGYDWLVLGMMLFLFGLQVLAVGFVGELLMRTHFDKYQEPIYRIERVVKAERGRAATTQRSSL